MESSDSGEGALRFQMSQTRQKLSWHEVISRIFSCKFLKYHITSVSARCEHYIFKIRQTVAVINMNCQFHDFLYFIFGGFLTFETTVRRRGRWRTTTVLAVSATVCSMHHAQRLYTFGYLFGILVHQTTLSPNEALTWTRLKILTFIPPRDQIISK